MSENGRIGVSPAAGDSYAGAAVVTSLRPLPVAARSRTWQTLRELRLERRLTLRQLAERAGVPYPYVSQIETGDRIPSAEQTLALARALELELDRVRVITQLVLVGEPA